MVFAKGGLARKSETHEVDAFDEREVQGVAWKFSTA
jgi:hypothetical protein